MVEEMNVLLGYRDEEIICFIGTATHHIPDPIMQLIGQGLRGGGTIWAREFLEIKHAGANNLPHIFG